MNQKKPIIISLNGKKIKISDIKKCSEIGKIFGLMFKSKEKANALLFEFSKPAKIAIHSLFVFFPFIALWLNDKNKVQEIKKITSFKLSIKPKNPFSKLIEIPLNSRYSSLIKGLS